MLDISSSACTGFLLSGNRTCFSMWSFSAGSLPVSRRVKSSGIPRVREIPAKAVCPAVLLPPALCHT